MKPTPAQTYDRKCLVRFTSTYALALQTRQTSALAHARKIRWRFTESLALKVKRTSLRSYAMKLRGSFAESRTGSQVRAHADAHPGTEVNAHVDLGSGARAHPDMNALVDASARLRSHGLLLRAPEPESRTVPVQRANSVSYQDEHHTTLTRPGPDPGPAQPRDHLHVGVGLTERLAEEGKPSENRSAPAGRASGQGVAGEYQVNASQGGLVQGGHGIPMDHRGYGQQYYPASWPPSAAPFGYGSAGHAGPAQGYHHAGTAYAPVPPPGAYPGYAMPNVYPPMHPGYQQHQQFLAPSQQLQAHPHPQGYVQPLPPASSPYNGPVALYPPPGMPHGFVPNGPPRVPHGRHGEQYVDAQQSQGSGPGGLQGHPPPA
ncbi:hypothetical protein BV20DRAFT_1058253 [Pilatotrama ljubarskyi]|nr:hypothetical protein BV20DRAFT_1058253 [Pilatotrama ljubarskyi]